MSLPKNASYTECMNYLTRPGALHETEDLVVDGRKITAFKNLPKTFRSFFLDKFGMYTDRTFLSAPAAGTDKRQYHTFAEIFDQSVALAAWLRAQGVERGDGVGIAGYNSPLWVTAFVATHLLGAVTVVLNASLNADSLIHCLKTTVPKITLVDAPVAETLAGKYNDKLKPHGVGPLYCYTPGKAQSQIKQLPQIRASPAQKDAVLRTELNDLGPDSDAHIFFTSGTTGYPKAVLSTQRMGLSNHFSAMFPASIAALRKGMPVPPLPTAALPQKVHLLAIPMFHVTGCLSWLIRGINSGTKLVFMDRWNVAKACEVIVQEKVNLVGGVPAIATQLVQTDLLPKNLDFDGVAYGGAPAAARLAKDIKERWPTASVQQGYGMTETNAYACGIAGDDYLSKPKSTGPPVPICSLRIVDPETKREAPVGQMGVIHLRGANIMKEYVRDPKATAEALDADGWMDTGDVGYVDEENFLFIADRAKDLIIRGGENIPSMEVENAILRDPRVSQVIAVPIPDKVMGELVGILYTLRSGAKAHEKSILEEAHPHLRKVARPEIAVEYHEPNLPTNANGKFVKKDLKHHVIGAWEERQKKPRAKL